MAACEIQLPLCKWINARLRWMVAKLFQGHFFLFWLESVRCSLWHKQCAFTLPDFVFFLISHYREGVKPATDCVTLSIALLIQAIMVDCPYLNRSLDHDYFCFHPNSLFSSLFTAPCREAGFELPAKNWCSVETFIQKQGGLRYERLERTPGLECCHKSGRAISEVAAPFMTS